MNGELKAMNPAVEVMISSADDLLSLTGLAPGSWAYIAGDGLRWQLDITGEWVPKGTIPEPASTEPE